MAGLTGLCRARYVLRASEGRRDGQGGTGEKRKEVEVQDREVKKEKRGRKKEEERLTREEK